MHDNQPAPLNARPHRSADPVIPAGVIWPMIVMLLAALVTPALIAAQARSWRGAADEQAAGRDARYDRGQVALDASRFDDAAELFRAVAEEGGPDRDAARYWQAWAEWKGGNASGARRTLARLGKDHPDSAWQDDARSLAAEIGAQRRGSKDDDLAATSDETLKLVALNSLMHSDAPQAVDAVVGLLERTQDAKLRERALFVLSQSSSQRAADILAEIARGERAPKLQRQAVRLLGMSGSEPNLRLLESIYAATDQTEIKASVIKAYFLADDEPRLLALAKGETDRDLRHDAIQKLGLVNANESLSQLYGTNSDVETKRKILHALFLADGEAFLVQVARTEQNPALRDEAIQSLGLIGATEVLRTLYRESKDTGARNKILHGLFLTGDTEGLIAIAKGAQIPAEREAAVEKLAIMDHDEQALAYLLEILEQ